MKPLRLFLGLLLPLGALAPGASRAQTPENLRVESIVAWCIVPFDAKKRSPAERARMLADLGMKRCAYDWRAEHVAEFEEEILQYEEHGIEFFAFWSSHEEAFDLFAKHGLHPQIWQTAESPEADTRAERIEAAARALEPLARRSAELGCRLGLYNHGGWGGEPENLVAVCRRLREKGHDHVGIVYNWHHGHERIADWAEALGRMRPYLLCLNLNGMNSGARPKILPLGLGEHDLAMLRAVVESGYDGPIGILNHTEEDAEARLRDNLDGLAWLVRQLDGSPPGPRPHYRTWTVESAASEGTPASGAAAIEETRDARRDGGEPRSGSAPSAGPGASAPATAEERALLLELAGAAVSEGDAERGMAVFAAAESACLSCHRIGRHGGTVGPELTELGRERAPAQIIESLLWPGREVRPEYLAVSVLARDGRTWTGYRAAASPPGALVLVDPPTGTNVSIERDQIVREAASGTLMPEGLTAAMTRSQKLDLIRFLTQLGRDGGPAPEVVEHVLAHAHAHEPASFDFDRAPLQPASRPDSRHHVNRERVYDFYGKQAEFFRRQHGHAHLLSEFPGLDGGRHGHWGNQDERTWAGDAWNRASLGTVQCGVLRGAGRTVPRAVCVRLGERGELSACFNPDTLAYEAVWSGGFVTFSSVRHGFLDGLRMDGTAVHPRPAAERPPGPFTYRGFYRHGKRVVFSYRIGGTDYLDAPWVEDGRFVRTVAPVGEHPLEHLTRPGPAQWPERLETGIVTGRGAPYAIDTIELPLENPWNVPLFPGGHAFLRDGSALVCTMQGDVWRVSGLGEGPEPATAPGAKAVWRRFAAGLHQALGIVVTADGVFVQGRDQLTRLHDRDGDGEADFYECFSNAFLASPAGHDFICGLETDGDGNFYTASGNQGLLRISADGQRADAIATGLRNPDGLGIHPAGLLTVPASEGEWTPASMVCAVPLPASGARPERVPHFGYGGPKRGEAPDLPLVYLPRGIDNSSGGQVYVSSDRWGPLRGHMVHFSYGAGSYFLLLSDAVEGRLQGAVVPLPGGFRSGAHRGRFSPSDGQLYVSGMGGWGTYTPEPGCFQRVRYTGGTVRVPVGFHVYENGLTITFSAPIERRVAGDAASHFAQCWNYRYSGAYGSAEYSSLHTGTRGHDVLAIRSAHVLADGRALFLELPDLQPVHQLHLRLHVAPPRVEEGEEEAGGMDPAAGAGVDLFATVHRLDGPFTEFPGYRPTPKTIRPHPMEVDLALATRRVPNPWRQPIEGARPVRLEVARNLTFAERTIAARAGEPIRFTLVNPDVVPHNWVLARTGSLERVGEAANRWIADPEAYVRHYVPLSDDVLVHTDIVPPRGELTIYFRAPAEPGRYPYLCTFPGHWMVMNGELVVR